LSNQAKIIAMLILPATTVLIIPLIGTYVLPAFGQALLPEGTTIDNFGIEPIPSANPFDLSGLGTQLYGLDSTFPLTSAPPLEFSQLPLSTFPPSASSAPGLFPSFSGANDLSLGAPLLDPSTGLGLSFPPTAASPMSSSDSSISMPVTIYACMDPASGNIPVNSIGPSSVTGCPSTTVPVVITVDSSTNAVSTCFIGPDMATSMSNCISSTPPLQQQFQQQPGMTLTPPFQ
jgi:hypothetical protein